MTALNDLATLRDKGSVPLLLQLLATERYHGIVTWVLADLGDDRAIVGLTELFQRTESKYVRTDCAEALVDFPESLLLSAGLDVPEVMAIARPGKIKALWRQANSIGKRMQRLENEPGGDPWVLIPEMEGVLKKCLQLDKAEARQLITGVKQGGLHMLELQALCDRLLKQTE